MLWHSKKTSQEELSLKDLTTRGLCDIHAHVLPGLDDGARDLSETLAILAAMEELGYKLIVATPHFDPVVMNPSENSQRKIIEEISRNQVSSGLTLLPGAEIPFGDVFFAEEQTGRIPCIGKGRTYLIEFGFQPGSVPPIAEDIFFKFRARGANPIIAHPERVPEFQHNFKRLEQIRRLGVLLQIDLTSLDGKHGSAARRTAKQLVERGLADIVASDIHRPTDLVGVRRVLQELAHQDEAALCRIASINPHLIVEGRFDEVVQDA